MIAQGLVIDWTAMPTYNTIMALATGAALCSLARVGQALAQKKRLNPEGWALNFGVLGLLLVSTGLHMTLTWPLAAYFPFDNIVFGEPSLAFGALLWAAAFYCWQRAGRITEAAHPMQHIARVGQAFRYLLYGLGLALIAIGAAGVTYQLFAAPPEEPITGLLANYPMVEASFISGLWAATGLGCLVLPRAFDRLAEEPQFTGTASVKWAYGLIYGTGIIFLLFGAFNYFTHIGLIVNTMG